MWVKDFVSPNERRELLSEQAKRAFRSQRQIISAKMLLFVSVHAKVYCGLLRSLVYINSSISQHCKELGIEAGIN